MKSAPTSPDVLIFFSHNNLSFNKVAKKIQHFLRHLCHPPYPFCVTSVSEQHAVHQPMSDIKGSNLMVCTKIWIWRRLIVITVMGLIYKTFTTAKVFSKGQQTICNLLYFHDVLCDFYLHFKMLRSFSNLLEDPGIPESRNHHSQSRQWKGSL